VIVVVDGVTRHEQAKLMRLGWTPFIGSSRSRLSLTGGEPGDSKIIEVVLVTVTVELSGVSFQQL
jgi:hypothetical protein